MSAGDDRKAGEHIPAGPPNLEEIGMKTETRTRFEASIEKTQAMKEAEQAGQVADSMDVRLALMERVHSGEITLAQAQAELKKIKAGAKKRGMITRSQAFSRG